VRVSRDDSATAAGDSAASLFLVDGESAVIGARAADPLPNRARLAADAMREKLAWQAPRLKFSDTPMSEVVAQFNRYSRMQLEIGDAELAARHVGGTFN